MRVAVGCSYSIMGWFGFGIDVNGGFWRGTHSLMQCRQRLSWGIVMHPG
jgi:hypothetical protein